MPSPESVDVLVVTAVDVELSAVLDRLKPDPGVQKKAIGANTYRLGTIGRYRCAVIMTEMGSGGAGGSALAVFSAISDLAPKAVLMVGIAFGRDEKSQQLGDLLVAKYIIPYELQRLGAERVSRAAHPEASAMLLNRARNLRWEPRVPDGTARRVLFGAVLSGEKLIDDLQVKEALFKVFPQAIGGEMEAAGVAAACHRGRCEWLVAKSICDWGDGNKKKDFQLHAAAIAAEFLEVLLSEDGLDGHKGSSTTSSSSVLTPADGVRAAIRADLDSAYEEHDRLAQMGRETVEIDKFILELKRQFREGGHLHEGDFLADGRLSFPGFPGHPARRVSSGLVHGIEDDSKAQEAHRRVQA